MSACEKRTVKEGLYNFRLMSFAFPNVAITSLSSFTKPKLTQGYDRNATEEKSIVGGMASLIYLTIVNDLICHIY